MAGFEVIIYGRFWVIAEENGTENSVMKSAASSKEIRILFGDFESE